MSTTLLYELTELIGAIDISTVKKPEASICKGDHVVGVMNEDLRALYGAWIGKMEELRILAKKLAHMVVDYQDDPSPPAEFTKLQKQACLLHGKVTILDELFWNSVRHQFPDIANKSNIGLRWGWKVVWSEDHQAPTPAIFLALLKKILGQE